MIDITKLTKYIEANFVDEESTEEKGENLFSLNSNPLIDFARKIAWRGNARPFSGMSPLKHPGFKNIEKKLKTPGSEDFISRLIFYINEKNMTHPQVYTAAGMTPDCFSKIMSGKTKTPKKETIVSLALALELNYDEAIDLLSSAGQTLCGFKQDVIFEFCFKTGPYSIDEVNEALVHFHFEPIGGRQ
ncbi:hypothetical protein SAMN02745152_02102 [Treponema berlinense]|uniref:Uncharacterized protein n=1 Tax=Treponema berlinense TaxID=225004 RepID=A0A1T4QSV3_9SPIR|nr:hypothetical protein [Treponema berlinense]SKA06863.1 hypothetical protein SAMN02745152_02102 [Treponema berlinense]